MLLEHSVFVCLFDQLPEIRININTRIDKCVSSMLNGEILRQPSR